MALIHRAVLKVFADYHQFYLADGGRSWSAPENWRSRDRTNRANVAKEVVALRSAGKTWVQVEVSEFGECPDIELGANALEGEDSYLVHGLANTGSLAFSSNGEANSAVGHVA